MKLPNTSEGSTFFSEKYIAVIKLSKEGYSDSSLSALQYDTVSDVVESEVHFASKILTPNRMD